MSARKTILVLNPNSNTVVTEKMAQGIANIGSKDEISFCCETLESGPFGIESQADIDAIIEPVCQRIAGGDELASVIACYSDPGLAEAKEMAAKPVFGIQESGIHVATQHHNSFGVIALSETSKSRHMIYIEKLGQSHRLAGERVADLTVAESASGEQTYEKLLHAGELLREQDKADVIILGCAGMARHRDPLEKALGVPVIDPVQAAAKRALDAVT